MTTADGFALTIIVLEAGIIAGAGACVGEDLAFRIFVGAFVVDLFIIGLGYKYFGEQRDIR